MCRHPVQLNCNFGHTFCESCISSAPHTVQTTETVYYDADNPSHEMVVKEDTSAMSTVRVTSTVTTCPECNVAKCTKMTCPIVAREICLLSIRCSNNSAGCQWAGSLSQLSEHTMRHCVANKHILCPVESLSIPSFYTQSFPSVFPHEETSHIFEY